MAIHTGQTGLAYAAYADSGTTMTNEPMTINAGRTIAYVTNAVKRAWDPDATLTVNYTGGTYTGTATVYRAGGFITFNPALDPGITVTVTGKYLPLQCIGVCKSFSLDLSWNTEDATVFPHCAGNTDDGWQRNAAVTKTASGSVELLMDDAAAHVWRDAIWGDTTSGNEVAGGRMLYLELGNTAASGYTFYVLGWPSDSIQASASALNTETISFVLGDDPPFVNYTEATARGYAIS